jgi:hypothetical protein
MSTMGATDGAIMPTIITAHIINMKRKSAAPQGAIVGVAIRDMSIPDIEEAGGDMAGSPAAQNR